MKTLSGRFLPVLICLTCVGLVALGEVEQTSSVLDGSGARGTSGSSTNLSASAQPGSVAVSSGGTMGNYAGFLGTFVLKPTLDTDNDGLADELDLDNDNDTLTDVEELEGTAFSPVTPTDPNDEDCDDDGFTDDEEASYGSDPWNAGSHPPDEPQGVVFKFR